MPVVRISQHFIDTALQCPPHQRKIEFVDKTLRGFLIEVTAISPGVGSYRLRYRDPSGLTRYATLGHTNIVSLEDARQAAKTLKAQIQLGKNPSAERKAKRAILTFDEFWNHHCYPYLKTRKRTADKDDERYRHRLKARFGHLKLDRITRHQLQTFHTELRNEGLSGATSDHYIKVIRRALNLGVAWSMLSKNPADRIPLFLDPNNVEHYLSAEELERLLTVLRTDRNRMVCSIAMFLLSTGSRLREALQAQWKHIDRQRRVWVVPAKNAKAARVRSIPLNASAIAVLDSLDTEKKFDHLFINRRTKKPFVTIYNTWCRLREEAELPNLRIHDLRHQFASFLVNSGRTLYEVQQVLGHSDPRVTQRYAHLSTKSLQEAADTAAVIINRASHGDTATD